MTLALAVALLALLVALFAVVALVAVYARVRALEAGRAVEVSGYAPLLGTQVPAAVAPRPGEQGGVVAVVDADCALCHHVWNAMNEASPQNRRMVAVADRPTEFACPTGPAELVGDTEVRNALFEGYSPTLLTVDPAGRVVDRTFVYADTDLARLLGSPVVRSGS